MSHQNVFSPGSLEHIQIVFFDIDGTLIDMRKTQISPKTRETLLRLQEKGIRICLATGRSPVTVPDFDGIEFDATVTFNGSLCRTGGKTVFSTPIDAQAVQKLLQNAEQMGRPVSIATVDRVTANGVDPDLAQYYSFAHLELTVSDDFEEVAKQDVYQVMLSCRESEYGTILQGVSGVKIAAWWDRAVDIIPAAGGKGIGIQKILDHYGLSKDQALAFGDGNNDIEMLQAVGTGVAMGNGSARLKAVAHDVCGHVADDGIYHYCLAHHLI